MYDFDAGIPKIEGWPIMTPNLFNRGFISYSLIALTMVLTLFTHDIQAAESDLSIGHSLPNPVWAGRDFTVTTGYANAGPDTAVSAYINTYFIAPGGLDVFIDDLVNGDGAMYDAIQASAIGTDTLGNAPLLFWDDFYCEFLFFQLQGENGLPDPIPIAPLLANESGSFSYETTVPMEAPNTGTIEINEPVSMAQTWTLTNPATIMVVQGSPLKTYATTTCEKLVGTSEEDICEYIADNCWGARISQLDEPIVAEFELVNDGTADPTLGCEALVGFTPGNIAVLRRGACEFGIKGFNAEQAGASAVFMVNSTLCSNGTTSDICHLNMGPGAVGYLVSIPMSMVAFADGEPVISALETETTVRGAYGTATTFAANGYVFLSDAADNDPIPDNDYDHWTGAVYGVGCDYALDSAHSSFSAGGGAGGVTLTTAAECYWEGSTAASWVSFPAGSTGTGTGILSYQVDANNGGGRATAIQIANQTHYVTQTAGNGCSYSIGPPQTTFDEAGGTGEIGLSTQPGCEWTASATAPWVRVSPPATGTGSATITYSVLPAYAGPRTGAVLVADRIHTVSQLANSIFWDDFETGDTLRWDQTSP